MKKVIHLHSDHKFIMDSDRYMGDFFENQLIILGAKNSSNSAYHDKALFFEQNSENLADILTLVNTADILVVYNLDFFKSQIVNRVNESVKVIWRFFGTELYSRKLHLYLSTRSKSFFKARLFKDRIKSIFRFLFPKEKLFYEALKRSDAISGVFKAEYDYLAKHFKHLPKFIPLSLENMEYANEIDFELEFPKKGIVILGNSRASYNNHLDILELAENGNLHKNISFKVLFNYGTENEYTHEVRKKAVLGQVELIDSFIPSAEFTNFYAPVAAFVTNSFRQLALANIFLALHKGVKVYLNKKNPTYTWFKEEGLYIYDTEDLKRDLETEDIYLSKSEIKHNLKCLKNLRESRSKTDFQMQVLQVLHI